MLHIRSRLFSVSPHISTSPTACFAAGGGAAASWVWGMYCTSVGIRAEGRGGMSQRSILAWSFESNRLKLERASTASAFVDVWAQIQCNIGVTMCSRPKDASLSVNRIQAFIGVNKGDPNNGCMRASGAMTVFQTATVSGVVVPSGSIITHGPVVVRAVLISAMVGAGTSRTVSQ